MEAKDPQLWPDEKLLEWMQQDDQIAFKRIYIKYSSLLYSSAYNLLREKQTCEDIIQDLFVHLWTKRRQLKITSLKAYLYTATRNRVLMAIRSGKAQIDPTILAELTLHYTTDSGLIEKDIGRILDEGVKTLPERCRQVFHLSRKEQLSNKEIAARLKVSPKTVENQITIALRRLRTSFDDYLLWAVIFLAGLFTHS